MNSSNFAFLAYGLVVAWLILFAYVGMLASRERRIKRELDGLKQMLKDR
jgi:CcmD family protein